ncbi:MAG: HTTM domain-containing protein [Solirubrobacterales bacterium]
MNKALRAWDRFWFEEVSTAPVALIRIALGAIVTLWTISLFNDAESFFTANGILASMPPQQNGGWSLFQLSSSYPFVLTVLVVLLLAAIALTLGWHSRIAAVLVFIGLISVIRRDPYTFNSGDVLLKAIAFFVIFAPTSASLSLDRYRKNRDDFWRFPKRAIWPLRLLQIQMSVIYTTAVWDKVRGVTWNNGTAASYAQRLDDLARFRLPNWITTSEPLANMFTFGTLAVELALGLLVWNKTLRPWVLLAGVGLHLGIDLTIRVGFFSYTILLLYIAFVSPKRAEQFVHWVRSKLAAIRLGSVSGRFRRDNTSVHASRPRDSFDA